MLPVPSPVLFLVVQWKLYLIDDMKRAIINRFAGMSEDRYDDSGNKYGFTKHFDVLRHQKRLTPIRGMTTDTASTGIGNIIVAANGIMYGVGLDIPNNPTLGKLWARTGYGGSDGWASYIAGGVQTQLPGATGVYDLLVDWKDCGHVRSLHWAANNVLVCSDPVAASSVATSALTFASIGQGLVHPKDSNFYFPYKLAAGTTYIGKIVSNATPFTGLSATAFTLPSIYRAYCLSYYGNYLAAPLANINGGAGGVNGSEVQLWDLDTSLTQPQEVIPWGEGSLKVCNNLGGILVGISEGQRIYQGFVQDSDSIVIRVWNGGPEPTVIHTIRATHLAASGQPSCVINPRVNFIYNKRLYFSINVVPNDGKQPSRYGLWSVGKNAAGEWTVCQEMVATNANTETGVIAAAIAGDFVSMCHTAEGTITFTTNGITGSAVFGASSVFESVVNQGMAEGDKVFYKKLMTIRVRCLPLPTGAQLTLKYRTDSDGSTSDWTTATTAYTTTGGVAFKAPLQADGSPFKGGYNFEFQLTSTGGATPTAITYDYIVTEE